MKDGGGNLVSLCTSTTTTTTAEADAEAAVVVVELFPSALSHSPLHFSIYPPLPSRWINLSFLPLDRAAPGNIN